MNVDDFRQMYTAELQEACSVEAQPVQALPKMMQAAHDRTLKQAIEMHLEETRDHQRRVQELLRRHGKEAGQHTDQAMQAIIGEAEKWAGEIRDPMARDAGLIASAQRVEHYEIAVYGTLATWAKQLGLNNDMQTLHGILEQEKQADQKLTNLAKSAVNPQAAAAE
jgi:ferritin-like metal-binding protein YciE